MKIGIMDSGIGGLTVLKECLAQLPAHEFLYYADSDHAPYGSKSPEVVYQLTEQVVDNLIELGAEIIVLACNTATSAAAAGLRAKYDIPIIGMEPAIKPALAAAGNKRVLVTATDLTLKQPKFRNLIDTLDAKLRVDYVPLTELVAFAEAGDFSRNTVFPYLTDKLADFCPAEYGSVVLGCTHFPLFKEYFAEFFPAETVILDGAVGTTKRIKDFATSESENLGVTFYISGAQITTGAQFDLIQQILNN
jgi:glutamate racemase